LFSSFKNKNNFSETLPSSSRFLWTKPRSLKKGKEFFDFQFENHLSIEAIVAFALGIGTASFFMP